MCTERVLHTFKADEGDWREVEALSRAKSAPCVRRAVVTPAVSVESGRTLIVGELACVYGITIRRRPAEPPPFRMSG